MTPDELELIECGRCGGWGMDEDNQGCDACDGEGYVCGTCERSLTFCECDELPRLHGATE